MKMTFKAVVFGSLMILAAVVFAVVILPYVHTNKMLFDFLLEQCLHFAVI